jgi:hypothetical protein
MTTYCVGSNLASNWRIDFVEQRMPWGFADLSLRSKVVTYEASGPCNGYRRMVRWLVSPAFTAVNSGALVMAFVSRQRRIDARFPARSMSLEHGVPRQKFRPVVEFHSGLAAAGRCERRSEWTGPRLRPK